MFPFSILQLNPFHILISFLQNYQIDSLQKDERTGFQHNKIMGISGQYNEDTVLKILNIARMSYLFLTLISLIVSCTLKSEINSPSKRIIYKSHHLKGPSI